MRDSNKINIIQTVASGGTAVLFKAVQTSLDRVVAVKQLHQHLTNDDNFTRRFILEAKAAASLDHENIVHVIDFGYEGDCYQMVMEFVEGESLSEILERWRPINFDVALAIIHQICLGLEHAHEKGIVHRDIKPGNVMITKLGKIKITDFGLAKLTQSATSQTAANSILGTPLYMSPEQAFGESVDQRSDLFSLGTVLYELLTGKQPFASENYMGVIQNIIHKPIPRVKELNPDIPAAVDDIVTKALNKNRDNRYQTAREIREDIEDYLGIVRLSELSESLKVLLQKGTTTQVIANTKTGGTARKKISKGRFIALLVFLAAAAGTAAVLIDPSLVDHLPINIDQAANTSGGKMQEQHAGAVDPETYQFDLGALVQTPESTGDTAADAETTGQTPVAATQRGNEHPPTTLEQAAETQAPVKSQDEPTPAPRLGWLSIDARPNAEIYVDGVYKGDTPPALSLKLPSGTHSVECRQPRYAPYSEELRIVTGELSRRNVTLKKLKGIISLATQEGAELYIDGALFGVTPVMKPIELDVGPHMVTLKKAGFFVWSSEVSVQSGKVLPLKITLSPQY